MKTCLVIAYMDVLYGLHARIEAQRPGPGGFAWMYTPEEAEVAAAEFRAQCERTNNTVWKFKIVNLAA